MATFIMRGKYSTKAMKKISSERSVKAQQIIQQCGGSNLTVYATMGESDILAIADFADASDAMKASVGLTRELEVSFATVPAIRAEEFDKLVGGKS
ncbi:MAG TPA: GYD domain-containing protein [Burkholderiales bacterium]